MPDEVKPLLLEDLTAGSWECMLPRPTTTVVESHSAVVAPNASTAEVTVAADSSASSCRREPRAVTATSDVTRSRTRQTPGWNRRRNYRRFNSGTENATSLPNVGSSVAAAGRHTCAQRSSSKRRRISMRPVPAKLPRAVQSRTLNGVYISPLHTQQSDDKSRDDIDLASVLVSPERNVATASHDFSQRDRRAPAPQQRPLLNSKTLEAHNQNRSAELESTAIPYQTHNKLDVLFTGNAGQAGSDFSARTVADHKSLQGDNGDPIEMSTNKTRMPATRDLLAQLDAKVSSAKEKDRARLKLRQTADALIAQLNTVETLSARRKRDAVLITECRRLSREHEPRTTSLNEREENAPKQMRSGTESRVNRHRRAAHYPGVTVSSHSVLPREVKPNKRFIDMTDLMDMGWGS